MTELLSVLREPALAAGFHQLCDLRAPPLRLRMRVLCPALPAAVSGLCDVEAPLDELARLSLSSKRVLMVENLESGLALPGLAGCAAVLGLETR